MGEEDKETQTQNTIKTEYQYEQSLYGDLIYIILTPSDYKDIPKWN